MSRMIRRLRVSMRHACLSSLPNVCPGTDLAGIMESSEPLESGLAGNKAYVSGVLGIYTRIGFPYQGRYPPVYKHFPVNVLLTAGKGVWKSEKDDQDQNVQQWFD